MRGIFLAALAVVASACGTTAFRLGSDQAGASLPTVTAPLVAVTTTATTPLSTEETTATTTAIPTTTTATTVTESASRAATSSIDSYVAAETTVRAAAAKGSAKAVWLPDASQRSPVVEIDGTPLAVVAYGFDPTGHPVQVLARQNGTWRVVASLAPPNDPGTVDNPDSLGLYGLGVDQVDNLAGHLAGAGTAFFIPLASAGCGTGAVVSDVGGTWRYLTFGMYKPPSQIVGGNPRFSGNALVSDDDCFASASAAHGTTQTWRYNAATGRLLATDRPGWPKPATLSY